MKKKDFHSLIKEKGYNFSTGVPCGVLKNFIKDFKGDSSFLDVISQNEPESVGVSVGAYLGGKKPIIYMQNSGFFKSSNELGSLVIPYKIPLTFLISHRGGKGEDAPQHFVTGGITTNFLDMLKLNYFYLEEGGLEENLNVLEKEYLCGKSSVILVKREGKFNKDNFHNSINEFGKKINFSSFRNLVQGGGDLNRESTIDCVVECFGKDSAIFSTTGLISRSLYERHNFSNQFYNTGGFGLTSSIALGFSLSKPAVRTVALDGDGSLLTNFGSIITNSNYGGKNFYHVVLDNKSYGSCSGEKTLSSEKISLTAYLNGYNDVFFVNKKKDLEEVLLGNYSGPTFVQVGINSEGRRDFKRPLDLIDIQKRFKEYFKDD